MTVLRLPSPTRRKGSENWYFRRTFPADVQRILAKLPKEKRPHGWYQTHNSISLGTADRALANTNRVLKGYIVQKGSRTICKDPTVWLDVRGQGNFIVCDQVVNETRMIENGGKP